MRHHLKLIWTFARVCIQDDAAYRFDFLFHAVLAVVQLCAELVGIWVIYSNTETLGGWSAWEILVLLGVFRVMIGMITLFIAPNMRLLMQDIRDGTLDFALMKPLNSQFFASFRRMVAWRVTDVFLGLALASFACIRIWGTIPLWRVGFFAVMLGSGAAIIYSLWLVLATCAFWFTRITNIEMVFWNLFEAGRYPVDIYRPWIRWGLTYLVPLAFLTTFPAGALAGKTNPANALAAIVFAILALIGSSVFWQYGLRRYSGASA
jgi:ABC-2 type transport system permease protein